jgi:hypothetical protein
MTETFQDKENLRIYSGRPKEYFQGKKTFCQQEENFLPTRRKNKKKT